jgi:hypothetical protein
MAGSSLVGTAGLVHRSLALPGAPAATSTAQNSLMATQAQPTQQDTKWVCLLDGRRPDNADCYYPCLQSRASLASGARLPRLVIDARGCASVLESNRVCACVCCLVVYLVACVLWWCVGMRRSPSQPLCAARLLWCVGVWTLSPVTVQPVRPTGLVWSRTFQRFSFEFVPHNLGARFNFFCEIVPSRWIFGDSLRGIISWLVLFREMLWTNFARFACPPFAQLGRHSSPTKRQ